MENDQQTDKEVGNVSYVNCQIFNGDIHGGNISMYGGSEQRNNRDDRSPVSKETIAHGIVELQKYFWGNSSYAVVFCVLRDCFEYPDNRSQFEREMTQLLLDEKLSYQCTAGVISSTINDNAYMKLDVSKWAQNGASNRVLQLVEHFKNYMNQRKLE